jgi:hypothetical protein
MKYIFTIMTILFCSYTHAGIYKCNINGKISYQQEPCEVSGGVGYELKKQKDITSQQQLDAKAKMDAELTEYLEAKQLKKEAYDKERIIRAEEDKAYAAYQSAQQAKRQANALEERNAIEARKRQGSGYYWGYGNYYRGRYFPSRSPWMYEHGYKKLTDPFYTIELGKKKTNLHNKTGALKKWQ